ncbi:hypothetical protein [Cryobacterium tagatosivorans]|uniref:Uncharacterized protein n=1 Tax=Cryobacterium tagatosivorans TaxID=1259199 RepID=A0A4R8UAT1_9MICO|nr:hypothetical protein [Cryobacterium tagatosivorans]TFB46508.1 hypothetical protein E3O23_17115 [Cryobacterium tagatosivorans]
MSISSRIDGWPTDHGPLLTLHELGLHDDLNQRPKWLHYPRTETGEGIENYHATTNFLTSEPLRALASLTLEGWQVFVDPDERGLRIKITPGRKTP